MRKKGPTVCDGVGTKSISGFKRSRLRTAQHDVEQETLGPLRLRGFQIKSRDQPLPGFLIGDGLKNGIDGKIHLGDQARDKRVPEYRKMDVGRTPSVVMIEPGIRARLDGDEAIGAVLIGQGAAGATEIRVQRRRMLIVDVSVATRRVGLPDLDEGVGNRASVAVEDAPTDDDALAERFSGVLSC